MPVLAAILVFATTMLWQHRFVPAEGAHRIDLSQLLCHNFGPGSTAPIRLEQQEHQHPRLLDLQIPDAAPIEFLHTDFQLRAEDLIPGDEDWEDGRLTIEWTHADGTTQSDYLSSAFHNLNSRCRSVVNHPKNTPATPVIRLEHRGQKGTIVLEKLEIFAVRESMLWHYGKWILGAGWVLWATALAGTVNKHWSKAFSAALVWTLIGTHIILPGPWHNHRPLGSSFSLTPPPSPEHVSSRSEETSVRHVAVNLGTPEAQGSLLLQTKAAFTALRPILHLGLFFIPTVVFLFLTSRWRAISLTASMAILVEMVQAGFGFGFDQADLLDLATNALGITAAVIVHAQWQRLSTHRRSHIPA